MLGGSPIADVVAFYRRKLPISEVFTGPPLGRSVNGVRGKVKRLRDAGDIDSSNRLNSYLKLLTMAEVLRPERLLRAPAAEVRLVIDTMIAEGVVLGPAVCAQLLEHRVVHMIKSNANAKDLIKVITPWSADDCAFDPQSPMLSALDQPMTVRAETFKRLYFRNYFAPMLMNEATEPARILMLCDEMYKTYIDEDLLNLDRVAAATLQECTTVCTAVKALIQMPLDATEYGSALEAINSKKGKTDRSIVTCVAAAIASTSMFAERLVMLLSALLVLMELGPCFGDHEVKLTAIQPDTAGFKDFTQMINDLTRANASSSASLFSTVRLRVREALLQAWASLKGRVAQDPSHMAPDLLQSVQACFQAAIACFDMDDRIVEVQQEVSEFVRLHDKGARRALLHKACDEQKLSDIAIGTDDFRTGLTTIQDALHDSDGLEIDLPTADKLRSLHASLVQVAMPIVQDIATAEDLELMFDLIGQIHQRFDNPEIVSNYAALLVMRSLHSLSLCTNCAIGATRDAAAPPNTASAGEAMHTLGVAHRSSQATIAAHNNAPTELVKKLLSALEALMTTSATMMSEYYNQKYAEAEDCLKNTKDALAAAAANKLDEDSWHSGVQGKSASAWRSLCAAFDNHIANIDTQTLEQTITKYEQNISDLEAAATLAHKVTDSAPIVADSRAYLLKAAVFLHEMLLVWHLKTEADPEAQRAKVQREIRGIRKYGLKERAVLHPAVFQASYDSLACRPGGAA